MFTVRPKQPLHTMTLSWPWSINRNPCGPGPLNFQRLLYRAQCEESEEEVDIQRGGKKNVEI